MAVSNYCEETNEGIMENDRDENIQSHMNPPPHRYMSHSQPDMLPCGFLAPLHERTVLGGIKGINQAGRRALGEWWG